MADLTGQRFGKISVINRNFEEQKKRGRKDIFWNCKCDCGRQFIKMGWELKQLKGSCGHCHEIEEIGNRYGKLTIIEFLGGDKRPYRNNSLFRCQCDCGNQITVEYNHLTSGHTQSCGCNKISQGELLIQNFLEEHNINYKKEYCFPDLKDKAPLRFDFCIFDKKGNIVGLIEFDGLQHIEGHEFKLDKNFNQQLLLKHDKMKNDYAIQHNIILVRIPYKDKTKEKIVKYLEYFLNERNE